MKRIRNKFRTDMAALPSGESRNVRRSWKREKRKSLRALGKLLTREQVD